MSIKAQVWGLDLIVAIGVISVALILFFTYSSDLSKVQENEEALLIIDAKTISNFLVSEGLPSDWDSDNVTMIGLTSEGKVINTTKVAQFQSLTDLNYTRAKSLLSSRSDFYIFFEDKNNTPLMIAGVTGIGYPGVNQTNLYEDINPENAISVERFVRHNSDIIRLGILVW